MKTVLRSCKALILAPIFLSFAFFANAQSIGTPTGVAAVCAGSTLNLSFQVTNGNSNNSSFWYTTSTSYTVTFALQSSPFTNTALTAFTSTTAPAASRNSSATINKTITVPSTLASGSYRITVSTPAPNSTSNNSSTFTVSNGLPTQPVFTADPLSVCQSSSAVYTVTNVTGVTYAWTYDGTGISGLAGQTDNSITAAFSASAGSGNLTVTPSNGCGAGTPLTVFITVNTPPVAPTGTNGSRCGTGTVTISATPGTGETIDWYSQATNGALLSSANTSFTSPSISTTTNYFAQARNTTTGCISGTRTQVTATVNAVPSVTTASTALGCSGNALNIALTASTPSSFSWTIGTVTGGVTGANPGSGTSITDVLSTGASSGTVQYLVTPVSNTGSCTGNAFTITVTVNPLPSISDFNIGATTPVCMGSGSSVTINSSSLTAGNYVVTYSLSGDNTSVNSTANMTMASGTGSFNTIALLNTGTNTQITISSIKMASSGCSVAVTSGNTAIIAVNGQPAITNNAASSICSGSSPNITLGASLPSTFTWTLGTNTGGITGANAGSGPVISDVLTNPSPSASGSIQYIVTPTTTGSSCAGVPFTITVTVTPIPVISSVTASPQNVCIGSATTLTANVTGAGPTTIVNYNFNGNTTPALAANITSTLTSTATSSLTTGGFVTGATAFTQNVPGSGNNILGQNPNNSWTFTLGGSALSGYKTFKVYLQATRQSASNNQVITVSYSLNGAAATTAGISGTNPQTATTAATPVEFLLTLPSSVDNPATSLAIIVSATGGNTTTILDNFEVQAVPSSINYSWTALPSGASAGLPANAGTSLSSNASIQVSPTVQTQYTVSVSNTTGCTATANANNNTTVGVNPVPSVTNNPTALICSGTSTNLTLTSDIASTFTWTRGTITGGITGSTASGSGATINQTLINPSPTTTGSVQYIITPTSTTGTCPGTPFTITVSVNPSVSVTNAATAVVCSGLSPNITLSANAASTFSWTIGTTSAGITGANAGSGTAINDILANSSATAAGTVQYIVTATSTATSCASAPFTITVTVNPAPQFSSVQATPSAVCIGTPSHLVATATALPGTAATIVNYNFNGSTAVTSTATNITSSVTGSSTTAIGTGGVASGGNAFTANGTIGGSNALVQTFGNSWTFNLGGSALPTYKTFRIYFQIARGSGGQTQTITVSYSLNGAAFTTTGITASFGNDPQSVSSSTPVELLLNLPTAVDNPTTSLAILVSGANGNTNMILDNFEVQAIPPGTNSYSWTSTPSDATAGLPANAGTPLASNSSINVNPTVNSSYTVTALGSNGCSTTATPVNVTANPSPTATLSGGAAYCSNAATPTQLSIALTGTAPWSVTYTDGTTPVTVTGILVSPYTFNVSPAVTTTYTVTAVSDANCSVTTASPNASTSLVGNAVITVKPAPSATISGTPTVCNGSNTTLSVALTGTAPFSFSYSDDAATVHTFPVTNAGSEVSGQVFTSASPYVYTINITPANSTNAQATINYTVSNVLDQNGCTGGTASGTGTVVVNPTPSLSLQTFDADFNSVNAATICNGTGTSLTVNFDRASSDFFDLVISNTVDNTTITQSTVNVLGAPISPTATNGDKTYSYYFSYLKNQTTGCVFTASAPSANNEVDITVISPPVITTQPQDQEVTYGAASATFTGSATGNGINPGDQLSYQWQVSTDGTTYSPLSDNAVYTGSLTNTLTVNNPTFALNGYKYQLVVSNTCESITISNSATLTVDKVSITITANDDTKNYGDTKTFQANGSAVSVTSGALINSDAITAATVTSTGSPATAPATTYPIVITGGSVAITNGATDVTSNYNITLAGGTLSVSKIAITITANNDSKNYGDTKTFQADGSAVSVTAGLLQNGDAITAATVTSTGSPASAAATTYPIVITGGTVAIMNGATDVTSNYNITLADGSLSVGKIAITIKANDDSKNYGETKSFLADGSAVSVTLGALVNGDAITGATVTSAGSPASAPAAAYPIVITDGSVAIMNGATDVTSNYNITLASGSLSVGKIAITIKANDDSKIYGDPKTFAADGSAVSVTSGALQSGDLITAATVTSAGSPATAPATTYPIVITDGSIAITNNGFDVSANYIITLADGTLTVNKAAITITANDDSKNYGDTKTFLADGSAVSVTTGTLRNGDALTAATLTSTGSPATAPATTYPIVITDGSVAITNGVSDVTSNYDITLVNGTLSVGKIALTITANNDSKNYGDTKSFLADGSAVTLTSGILQNGDAITAATVTSTGSPASAPATTYPIVITGGTVAIMNGATDVTSNYNITLVDGTLSVGKIALTITANDDSKNYGVTKTFLADGSAVSVTSGTLQNGDAITAATVTSTGSPAGAPATTYPIVITGGTVAIMNGATDVTSNYSITLAGGTLSVGKIAITITANDDSKNYGDTKNFLADGTAVSVTSGTLQNGDAITAATVTSAGSPASAPATTYPIIITDGSVAITNGATDVTSNYNITIAGGTLSVGKIAITITANDDSKNYGDTKTFLADGSAVSVTSGTLVNGDAVTAATVTSAGSPASAPATTYPIVITNGTVAITNGATDVTSNYNITLANGTLSVGKIAITLTANNDSKNYGDTKSFLADGSAVSLTSGTLQNGDAITAATVTSAGSPASAPATTYPIVITGGTVAIMNGATDVTSNYNITLVDGTLSVGKIALTITANDDSKNYGVTKSFLADGSAVSVTSGSLQNGDAITAATVTSTGSPAGAPATTYPIVITGGTVAIMNGATDVTSNYNITLASGTLSVGKVSITITANDDSKNYGDTKNFLADGTAVSVTSGTLVNGDAITAATVTSAGSPASAPATTYPIVITGGTVAITNGATDVTSNYNITLADGSLSVGKIAITVTAKDDSKNYGDTKAFLADGSAVSVTAGALVNGDAVTAATVTSTGSPASAPATTYPIVITNGTVAITNGATDVTSNYNITLANGTLSVGKIAITITANNDSKNYGVAKTFLADGSAVSLTSGTLQNGDAITAATVTSTGSPASAPATTYPIVITDGTVKIMNGATDVTSNYNITLAGGTLSVGKIAITVTAKDDSKNYGDTKTFLADGSAVSVTSGTLQNGDGITAATVTSTGSPASAPATTYPIVITDGTVTIMNGATDVTSNYNITLASGTLTVSKIALTIKANDDTKNYGDTKTFPVNASDVTITSGVLKNGDALVAAQLFSDGSPATAPATTYPIRIENLSVLILNNGQDVSSNYNITLVNGTLTVGKAALTIKANDDSKVFSTVKTFATDGSAVSVTAGSLVNGDQITADAVSSTGSPANAGVGPYPIVISSVTIKNGATDVTSNYTLTFVNGTLQVGTPPAIVFDAATVTSSHNGSAISCVGSLDGQITITAHGGTPALIYSLSGGTLANTVTNGTGVFDNLGAGNYNYTVTDQINFAPISGSIAITPPAALAASVSGKTNISCFGAGDGTATISVTGGTAPYQYSIDGGGYAGGSNDNGTTFTQLAAGSHTVLLKDANNCTVSSMSFSITQPAQLTASASAGTISCNSGTTSLFVIAGGGTTPYSYSLNSGAPQGGNVFTVPAGDYVVTVKDANGCTVNTSSVHISAPDQLLASITTQAPSGCISPSGSFTISASGGSQPYTYSFNGSAYTSNGSFTGIASGSYLVTAKDAGGCTVPLLITIAQATAPSVHTVTGGGSLCNAGTATVGLVGSDNGVSYQLVRNGNTNVGAALTGNGNNLDFGSQTTAGTYTVVATNNTTGCSATMSGSATVTAANAPTAYTVSGGGGFCSGAGVQVGLQSSQSGVTYQLVLNGSTNVGAMLTGNGNALSFGNQTVTGSYSVVATNTTTGCTSNMLNSVNVSAGTPPTPFSVVSDPNNCTGAGVDVRLAASQLGVNYQLYKNNAITGAAMPGGNGSPIDFGVQPSGTYTVVATDATTGCTNNMTGSVTVISGTPPTAFAVTGGGSYCSGGLGLHIGLASSETGVNYQLFKDNTIQGPAFQGSTGSQIDFGSYGPGVYTVVATNALTGCTNNMTGSKTIAITSPSVFNLIAGQNNCTGLGVDIQLGSSETGVNYQLNKNNTPTGIPVPGTGHALDFGNQPSGTYTVTASNATSSCTISMGNSVTVVSAIPPAVYNVQGSGSYCTGALGVQVTLSSSQSGVTYQLVRDGNVNVGSPLSGNDNSSLDFNYQTVGAYTVVATNTATGCTSNMNGTATITINNATPTITTQPAPNQAVCAGAQVSFTVVAGAGATGYQWLKNDEIISGAISATYTINAAVAGDAGTYAVIVTGSCGNTTSHDAVLGINTTTGGSITGGGISVCSGTNSTLLTLSGSTGTIVKWQSSIDNFNTSTDIANTTTTYTATNLTQQTSFRAVISGCTTVNSGVATIGITQPAVGGSISGSTTVCSGTNSTLLTLSGSTGTIVKWQSSTDNFGTSTDIANTSNTYTATNLTQQTSFRAVISGCTTVNSGVATIGITQATVAGTISGSTTVCSGTNSTLLTLSGYSGSIVKWQSSTNNFGTSTDIANTTNTYTATNLTQATTFRAVISGCTTVNSGVATIGITQAAVAGSISGSTTVCSGTNSTLLTLSGYTGTIVKWQSSTDNFGTSTDIANTTNTYTATNLTQQTSFRAVISGCTTVNSGVATIGITQVAVGGNITGGGNAVCSGTNSTLLTLNNYTGTITKWQYSTNNFGTSTDIPGTAGATTYTVTNLTQTRSYRAVITGCTVVNSGTTTISISAAPAITGQPTASQSVCPGATVTFSVGANNAVSYQWRKGGVNIGGATGSTYTIASVAAGDAATYSVVVIGTCTNATSGNAVLAVKPATAISTQPVASQSVCMGTRVSLSVTATGATGYQWRKAGVNISGATSASYTIAAATAADAATYSVMVNGTCNNVTSHDAVVVVNVVVGGHISGSTSVCSTTNTGTLTLSGQSGAVTRWQSSTNGVTFGNINNTTTSLTYTHLTQTTYYRALISGCTTGISDTAVVTVNPPSVGGTVSGSTSVCSGSNSGVVNLGGQSGSVIRWESSIDNGAHWATIANTATTQSYSNLAQTTQFRAVVMNGSCASANATPATITVTGSVAGGNISGSNTVCAAGNSGTLNLFGQQGTISKWQSSIDNGSNWSDLSNQTTSQNYSNLTVTTQYRAVLTGCTTVNSGVATITVSPVSVGGTAGPNATVCGNASGTITLTGQTGSIVRWESSTNGGGTWTTIANTSATQNYSNLAVTTMYHAVVQSGSCSSTTSAPATITVGAPIAVNIAASDASNEFCKNLTLTATATGAQSYAWSNGGTGQSIALGTNNAAGNYSVTVTTANGCTGTTSFAYNPQTVASSYTAIGKAYVIIDNNNTFTNGSAGATNSNGYLTVGKGSSIASPGAFARAGDVSTTAGANVPVQINKSPAPVVMPTMQLNTSSTSGLGTLNVANNTTNTYASNYSTVTVGTNSSVTLTGSVFGKITVGAGSIVTFTQSVVNVGGVVLNAGTTTNNTRLNFSQGAVLKSTGDITMAARTSINEGNQKVVMYLGNAASTAVNFVIATGGNINLNGSVFSPNGAFTVGGDAHNTTTLTGKFIANQVASFGSNILWTSYDCASAPVTPSAALSFDAAPSKLEVTTEEESLAIQVTPNPTQTYFTLVVSSSSKNAADVKVFDMAGRVVDQKRGAVGESIRFGSNYVQGMYIVQVIQGTNQKLLKVVKN